MTLEMETKEAGFWTRPDPDGETLESALAAAAIPTERADLRGGAGAAAGATVGPDRPVQRIGPLDSFDQSAHWVELRTEILDAPVLDAELLRRAKRAGLSDRCRWPVLRPDLARGERGAILRHLLGRAPGVQDGGTPAPPSSPRSRPTTTKAPTTTDPATESEIAPQTERPKVLILGSGPNRIGQASSSTTPGVHAVDGAAGRRATRP